MSRIVTIHNVSGISKMYAGQTIADTETYTLDSSEENEFKQASNLFVDVGSGDALIGNGSDDIADSTEGWAWLQGDTISIGYESDSLIGKLAVHTSFKPHVPNSTTYAVWTGAGDDVVTVPNVLGEGELLHFNMVPGTSLVIKDIKFSPDFGRVWIHEAYLKFTDGGEGDYISADMVATGVVLQTSVNLDLELDGDYVKFAAGGVGTGTHGFAATPVLIPRNYSKDGDWDYDGTNLIPNMSGTGEYYIKTVDTVVHRYVNKIPTYGDCPYFSMSSDETTEILSGYFLRVNCHNNSNTTWNICIILEIYRERTV